MGAPTRKSLWDNKGAIIGGTLGTAGGPAGTALGAYAGSQFDPGKGDPFHLATASARSAAYKDKGTVGFRGGGLTWQKGPGAAPDLTDEVVRAVQRAERNRHQVGRTRASTFVSANQANGGGY